MRFEHQAFQEQCVNNIITVFENYNFKDNKIEDLKENLKKFYDANNDVPKKLQTISNDFKKLDILMETGTGKTFTYLKTIFEMNKKFNINKFIIFVPRKAIREGVRQNISLTDSYFYSEEGYKKHLNQYFYDGDIKSVNGFIRNKEELSVLILTNSSIDKKENNLRKSSEFFGKNSNTLDEIVKLNPVIFLDEPHLLKGDAFAKIFIEIFGEKSIYIRFGATFPKVEEHKLANAVYVLDSISSFQQYLVKGIRVNTISSKSDILKLREISGKSKDKVAKFSYTRNGIEYESIDLKVGNDIGSFTGLSDYNGISIVNIKSDSVFLSNRTEMTINDKYVLSHEDMEFLIERTIRIHFEKEEKLFEKGIKTLSLFFIPNVSDFRGGNQIVKNIFEKKYKEIRKEFYNRTTHEDYKKYLDKDFDEKGELNVDNGYFSGDKGTQEEKEKQAVDKILNDKEKLLSLNEPLRFIFSVWALQEGWDNPNIFNICKLANSGNDISRRQQVGRGLRLAVNQNGQRITYDFLKQDDKEFYNINTLDVVVSDYEGDFIGEIQKEIVDNSYCIAGKYLEREVLEIINFNSRDINKLYDTLEENGIVKFVENIDKYEINSEKSISDFVAHNKILFDFLSDEKYQKLVSKTKIDLDRLVVNGNKQRIKVKIRENKFEEFRQLWETINRKAKIVYHDIKENELIEEIAKDFNVENIQKIVIKCDIKRYNPQNNEIIHEDVSQLKDSSFFDNNNYSDFVNYFIKKHPIDFILSLFNKLDIQKIRNNPKKSKELLEELIKNKIHGKIIEKVDYEFSSEIMISNSLQDNNGKCKKEIDYTLLGKYIYDGIPANNYLYDKAVGDSNVEKDIIEEGLEKVDNSKIVVYAKLPKISIPTPYKTYNPDFAYLIERENSKKIFLVVEAKGYNNESNISEEEQSKIEYAKIFFKKLQKELKDVDVVYKTRLNKEDLINLIK